MPTCDSDERPTYDIRLKRKGRSRWQWLIYDDGGRLVMSGLEGGRAAASYASSRALFLLLSAASWPNQYRSSRTW
jgi:hypothetical protein